MNQMKWRHQVSNIPASVVETLMAGFQIDPTILREYDIRGTVPENFNPDVIYAIARGFGTIAKRDGCKSMAIGYDGRLSSPELEAAAVRGFIDCGLKVFCIGQGPSPMLYFATFEIPADAGLMITGSHNPANFNGAKMVIGGQPFWGPDIQKLGQLIAQGDFETGEGEAIEYPIMDTYIDRVFKDFSGNKQLTVAWDTGNGVSGDAVRALTAKLPGEHVLINIEIDGTFPNHHPDPTVEKNLEQLKEVVCGQRCDLGFAFDGDGDRLGLVDSQGRVLWGDQMLIILAGEVLADMPGSTIIADVKASQVFFDEIDRMGGTSMMWQTGHSNIKSKMKEIGSPLAGEMSAHIFFGHKYYGYDDALYAAVRLLGIISRSDKTLDQMLDDMPKMITTPEARFPCPEERKFKLIDEVKERLKSKSGIIVHDIDGVRVQSDDGWWLLRASNTEPVLSARCESSTVEGLVRVKAAFSEEVRASGLEPPDFK
ncbi:MAG: phosphoglucomutase/phosphomannomutase PgmG [Rhodospirillales bacterium]|jgi:phosphomannomutase